MSISQNHKIEEIEQKNDKKRPLLRNNRILSGAHA